MTTLLYIQLHAVYVDESAYLSAPLAEKSLYLASFQALLEPVRSCLAGASPLTNVSYAVPDLFQYILHLFRAKYFVSDHNVNAELYRYQAKKSETPSQVAGHLQAIVRRGMITDEGMCNTLSMAWEEASPYFHQTLNQTLIHWRCSYADREPLKKFTTWLKRHERPTKQDPHLHSRLLRGRRCNPLSPPPLISTVLLTGDDSFPHRLPQDPGV